MDSRAPDPAPIPPPGAAPGASPPSTSAPQDSPGAAGPPVVARPPRRGRDPIAIVLVVGLLLVAFAFVAGATVLGRAWWLHRAHRYDEEIAWLGAARDMVPFDAGLDVQIMSLHRERVRYALDQGRLAEAVQAFRIARREEVAAGGGPDPELMALGIEAYTRAADHVERLGRLSAAADWDDSLFVLAIRAPQPHHRFAASAAFMEALDLRVRDGQPCAALARLEWAKRGLGGEVPGLSETTESDLRQRCDRARRGRGR